MEERRRTLLVAALLLAATACTQYEYEEEFQLNADGSGTVRISGSEAMWRDVHGLKLGDSTANLDGIQALYESEPLRITSLTETGRGGKSYLHVQINFDSLDDFCSHPANRHRECGFDALESHVELRGQFGLLAERAREVPSSIDPVTSSNGMPLVAFRFHLPAIVQFHNGDELERGNIVRWQASVDDYLRGKELPVEVRMDNQSILALTLRIVLLSVAVVLGGILLALTLLHRKGVRQLRAES